MGTAEIESAPVAHPQVAESAVVGYPHDIKGQGIYAYVTLIEGVEPSDELRAELRQWTCKEIGSIATPDLLQGRRSFPRHGPARSCAAFCAKLLRMTMPSLVTHQH